MNVLLTILGLVAALLIIVFIAANFAPNHFSVYAETVINQPVSVIFSYIRYLKDEDKYNKWVMTDPNVKRTYTGTDGFVGGTVYWDSESGQVGKGEQEIVAISENQRIDWKLRFEKPFKNEAASFLETTSLSPEVTRVKWGFTGELTYMMKVMHMVLSLKKALTKDLTISLANLKTVLEK